MQTLRTQLQVARLDLIKRRVAKSLADKHGNACATDGQISRRELMKFLMAVNELPQSLDDALSLSVTQTH